MGTECGRSILEQLLREGHSKGDVTGTYPHMEVGAVFAMHRCVGHSDRKAVQGLEG